MCGHVKTVNTYVYGQESILFKYIEIHGSVNGTASGHHLLQTLSYSPFTKYFLYIFSVVGSAWSLVFFIPATTANDLRLRRISIPDLMTLFVLLFETPHETRDSNQHSASASYVE